MDAVAVLGTLWVWILSRYRCMRTPGIPVFAQNIYIYIYISQYGSGQVRVRYGLGTSGTKTKPNGVISTRFLLLSYSILSPLSQAKPHNSLSHFLTLLATSDRRCSDCGLADCGLAATEGALIVDLRR